MVKNEPNFCTLREFHEGSQSMAFFYLPILKNSLFPFYEQICIPIKINKDKDANTSFRLISWLALTECFTNAVKFTHLDY